VHTFSKKCRRYLKILGSKGDMKRILQRELTGIRNHLTKYSHPSDLAPGICTLLLYAQYIYFFSLKLAIFETAKPKWARHPAHVVLFEVHTHWLCNRCAVAKMKAHRRFLLQTTPAPQTQYQISIKWTKSRDLTFSQRHCSWSLRWRHYVPSNGL
jgi:hypothetical protein